MTGNSQNLVRKTTSPLLIALGIWRFTYAHDAYGHRIAVVIICLGASGILIDLLVWRTLKSRQKIAARKILDMQKSIYRPQPHEYRIVQPSQFQDLDFSFYDRFRDWAQSKGLTFLGDRENLTLTRQFPTMRTMLRTMVSNDHSSLGICHHIRTNGRVLPRDVRTIEFETEFSDGTFMVTSNTPVEPAPYPCIDSVRMLPASSADEMFEEHCRRLAGYLAGHPQAHVMRVENIDQCIQFQHRMQDIKARYKESVGFAGKEDLERLSRTRGRDLNENERGVGMYLEKLKQEEG